MITKEQIQSNNTNHEKHFNNVMWVTFASIFARAMYFISSIVAARYLFPKDFGIISIAVTFYSLIECSSTFGVDSFFIYRQNLSKKEINSIYILNIFVAFLFALIFFLSGKPLSILYKTPEIENILVILSISFFINRTSSNYKAMLMKKFKQDLVSKIEVVTNLLDSVLIIIFAMMGFKYLSYILPILISQSLMLVLYMTNEKWDFSLEFDKKIIMNALSYSKNYMPQALLSYFLDKTDYIFVGYLLGSILLGYYYFGYEKAILIILVIRSIITTSYMPIFAKLQSDTNELHNTFKSMLSKLSYMVYPILFGLILLAPEFLNIVFGNKWNNAIFTFQLILGYLFLKLISDLVTIIFNTVGHPEQNLRHYALMAPFFIISFYLGTKYGGLRGISITSFVVQTIGALLLILRYCKFYEKNLFETLVYPKKIIILLIIQALILIPLKIFLYKIGASCLVTFGIIMISCIALYYVQTRFFLIEIYQEFLIPLVKKLRLS